jgi:hypothetical protein
MKKIKEQIDYGNQPERMDPNLERKLGDPEGLYAKNPAMRKGAADVQRLISSRFQKVTEKLKQVTGQENLTSRQVKSMLYSEMASRTYQTIRIESGHKDELEQLAVEICLEETETSSNWYKIEPYLNREPIDVSNFRYNAEEPSDEEEEDDEEKPEKPQIPSFDIEDLTDEEEFELEKHKRNIINAIIQGAAKKGHYVFQKPEVKSRLDAINPSLYQNYLYIMAINDFLYFDMEQAIEAMSQTGQGVAGKVELADNDDDEDGEEGDEGGEEEKPDTVIRAYGLLFPILCHEIIKGMEEGKGRHGLPQDQGMRAKVLGQTDVLNLEPMQLRIGPEVVEKLRFSLPDEMFDESNKGLINWFHILLYQIPAQEFLKIMGDVISADPAKNKKATQRFEEIMREAINMKEEFDNYKEEKGEEPSDDSDDEDDEDLDDFLSGLGISRPK